MQNASPVTAEDAIVAGKQACPVCVAATCYATAQGRYYHRVPDCSGMAGAVPVFAEDAVLAGKEPCPVCIAAPRDGTARGSR